MIMMPWRKRRLLKAYNEFGRCEYGSEPLERLPKDKILPLCYTTYEFDDASKYTHDIQVNFDLKTMSCKSYIDDELVIDEPWDYETLLLNLEASFDDLIRDCVHKGFDLEEEGHFEEWKKWYDTTEWKSV